MTNSRGWSKGIQLTNALGYTPSLPLPPWDDSYRLHSHSFTTTPALIKPLWKSGTLGECCSHGFQVANVPTSEHVSQIKCHNLYLTLMLDVVRPVCFD